MGKHICANKTTAILNSWASSSNMLMGEENWDPYPAVGEEEQLRSPI